MFPELKVEETELALQPGDLVIAFSDGVPEALNASGEEFGEKRLQDLMKRSISCGADDIASQISDAVRRWMDGAEQHDDVTVVVIKV